jgi:hypothetical protein
VSVRKLAIGLVVLGTLLVLFLGYARISGTDRRSLQAPEALPLPAPRSIDESNGPEGRIGDTSIGPIDRTRFFHRDEAGRVDREFGFDEFLHKQGNQWRLTHPYMKQFLNEFQCHITADAGEVRMEDVLGQPIPNDALFQGNVVIHIIPPRPDDPRECFIYLDDVTFVAEKSLFSSTGPVRFVSRSAMLEGVGMELIYDSMLSRLELFRIVDLKSLRGRSADIGLFTSDKGGREGTTPAEDAPPPAAREVAGDEQQPSRVSYECMFFRNVVIDAPDGVVVARDRITIDNLIWSRDKADKSVQQGSAGQTAEPNETAELPEPAPDALNTTPSTQLAFENLPVERFDILATCDGGCVIAPSDAIGRFAEPDGITASEGPQEPAVASVDPNRQRAIGERVEYDAATGDGIFVGPVETLLWLDPNQLTEGQSGGPPVPLTVTARNRVRFLAAPNQVIFEGDCLATAEKTDPNFTQTFTLSAPTFVLDLAEEVNAPTPAKRIRLERFATDGGPASIVARKRAADQLLGWTRVLASRLEYEAGDKLFTAYGPGEMQVRNAQVTQPRTDPNAFGFDQPCYAFLTGFDQLVFAADTNRIAVTSDKGPILFDYIPVVGGTVGQHIWGDTGRLDLALRRAPNGQMELLSLTASGGIQYEEEKGWQFSGDKLVYDGDRSIVSVTGGENRPCYFNGALVDWIEMNVKTRSVKTQLQAPSIFQGQGAAPAGSGLRDAFRNNAGESPTPTEKQ